MENNSNNQTITLDDSEVCVFDILTDEDRELITPLNVEDVIVEAEEIIKDEKNFNDVLVLTEYTDGSLDAGNNMFGAIAEYNEINTLEISTNNSKLAKNFVKKITNFILEFNDVELTEAHKSYIESVGELQFQHLSDSLYLVEVNKQMLNNIINRINATQAEDYVIINSYNNLVTQHLKLIKETQLIYKTIPTTMKKMKDDVITAQSIEGTGNDELLTEDFNQTHYNNQKQLLRKMLENYDENENK